MEGPTLGQRLCWEIVFQIVFLGDQKTWCQNQFPELARNFQDILKIAGFHREGEAACYVAQRVVTELQVSATSSMPSLGCSVAGCYGGPVARSRSGSIP